MSLFTQPWPWYVAGPLIGLTVPLLLWLVGKPFGVSSSFRHLCTLSSPGSRLEYLKKNDVRAEKWNLFFVLGVLIGAGLAANFLMKEPVPFLPENYYSVAGGVVLFLGGMLVGFGTRYANGCTSGHSIMGIASGNWPSLVATVCFFAGGLAMYWLILPLLSGLPPWNLGAAP